MILFIFMILMQATYACCFITYIFSSVNKIIFNAHLNVHNILRFFIELYFELNYRISLNYTFYFFIILNVI